MKFGFKAILFSYFIGLLTIGIGYLIFKKDPTPIKPTPYQQVDGHTGISGVQYGQASNGAQTTNTAHYISGGSSGSNFHGSQDKGIRYIELFYKDGPPVGYAKISPDGKIYGQIYANELLVKTDVYQEKGGKVKIVNTASFVLKETGDFPEADKKWINKPYPLDIIGAESVVDLEAKNRAKIVLGFYPDLGFNSIMVVNQSQFDIVPNVGVSILGYGNDELMKYKFLRVAVGARDIDNGVNVSVAPVMYSLGNIVPFMKNTYIAPVVGFDKRKLNFGVGLGLGF